MLSLGLRFSLKGGREVGVRVALTAFGVAVGVALLLFTLSGFAGLKAKDAREGWLLTSAQNKIPSLDESTSDALWWRPVYDSYGEDPLIRVEVAATGKRSPVTPGIERLPEAGEYYASPELARLIASTPGDVLGERFPGRRAGIIGEAGLTSPNALIAVVGRRAGELSAMPGAQQVRSIEAAPKEHDYNGFFKIVLGLGALGLLIPVLMFVATSTRLAAAQREERFAALRLVGATPRQVNQIAAVEACLTSVVGVAVGFAGFYLFRPLVARIPFTGDPFFTSDLSLGPLTVAGVALGVPLAAVLAGLLSLRRVQISPLGVSRRQTPKPPRAWRLSPVVAGLGVLAATRLLPRGWGDLPVWIILGAFVLIIVGLTIAGPWLTMVGARLLARLARHDSTLIAGRRLSDDPGRAFRAISGLVLAVFVGTVFVGVINTTTNHGKGFGKMTLPAGSVTLFPARDGAGAIAPARAQPLLQRLRDLAGVRQVLPVYETPGDAGADDTGVGADDTGAGPDDTGGASGLVSAADWDRLRVYGPAQGGATGLAQAVVTVPVDTLLNGELDARASWPAIREPAAGLTSRPLKALLVTTDGDDESVERVRTALQTSLPAQPPAVSASQLTAESRALVNLLQRMVDVGIILSLVIAGCSLAVSVAGGLMERKRPFTLLRLTGMPLAHLRRVVVLEAAVPLVLVALVSAAAGFLAADLILRATPNGFSLSPPSMSYYVIMAGGLVAALAVVGITLPLLDRVTQVQAARTE